MFDERIAVSRRQPKSDDLEVRAVKEPSVRLACVLKREKHTGPPERLVE
jgi:hypothetical protein